jgi:sulfite reductase (NADPH) hemoprotein beta-component
MDYCALATARSIPVAQAFPSGSATAARQAEIGELKIKISGCINACGHHHVGHIGILGLEKKGEEFYQVTLGGSANENASIGEIIGRGFSSEEVVDASLPAASPWSPVSAPIPPCSCTWWRR